MGSMNYDKFYSYFSRRSPVVSSRGIVSCINNDAGQAGIKVLQQGGNAADAAIACAAALGVVEPWKTGLGGDSFIMFYDSKKKVVNAINASGRSSSEVDLDLFDDSVDDHHALNITIPGTVAGWFDTMKHFGSDSLNMMDILTPAIDLARDGFCVPPIASWSWNNKMKALKDYGGCAALKSMNGIHPLVGDIQTNIDLASTMEEIARFGAEAFYQPGRIADAIVDAVVDNGGRITNDDLSIHTSTFESPISTSFQGVEVWEMPPNSQGCIVLEAINILKHIGIQHIKAFSAEYYNTLVSVLSHCMCHGKHLIADPAHVDVDTSTMLSEKHAKEIADTIGSPTIPQRSNEQPSGSLSQLEGDTVYLCVVDKDGNSCSYIGSLYQTSGIVPEGCGFLLHNRGALFSKDPNSANVVSPGKRPYTTLMPAILTDEHTGEFLASFGVTGGFMQPQGHIQLLLNMLIHGLDPQKALDQPRIFVNPATDPHEIFVESGMEDSNRLVEILKNTGNSSVTEVDTNDRFMFGHGQIITKGAWWNSSRQLSSISFQDQTYWAGSDMRADGAALPNV